MSASSARIATVLVWREYHDMDGLGGAEMLEHGAGVATTGSTNSRLGCVRDESHQVERPTKRQREATLERNSAVTWAAWALMAEHNVSSAAAPKLFTSMLQLLGFRVRDKVPAQNFMVDVLRVTDGLARAEIGLSIAELARTSPQQQ